MFIKTDKEGAQVIRDLCDVALRAGGMANLAIITRTLNSMDFPGKPVPKPEPEPETPAKPKKKE
jgi:hypothetical protein